jgi:hypothetical protein
VLESLLRPTGRKLLAAAWFAAIGLLAMALFFFHPPIALRAVLLYILAPALSSALAGYLLGGAILDPARTTNYGQCLLRGLGVTAAAFLIFAVFFACALPVAEQGWSFSQIGALFLGTIFFGLIMTGPVVAAAGMLAALGLYMLGRRVGQGRDGRGTQD